MSIFLQSARRTNLTRRQFLAGSSALLLALSAGTWPALADLASIPAHPRLILTANGLTALKALLQTDTTAQKYYRSIKAAADKLLAQSVLEYKVVGTTPRLLAVSTNALNRLYTLALVYRIEQDTKYAERARAEMLNVAAFADWHPVHFLDTAVMTHAVSIGYDWCYDVLSDADRTTIARAIRQLGLEQSVTLYKKRQGWTTVSHNWNLVCNGGMTVGALAIADLDKPFADQMIGWTTSSVKSAMATYAPDGGWPEGPGYWDFGTSYAVVMLAALKTATGTDQGLSKLAGFAETGLYRLHFVGPTGQSFNFADAGETQNMQGPTPELNWLAQIFEQPIMAWAEQQTVKNPAPLDVVWYNGKTVDPTTAKIPTSTLFKGVNVAFMRNAWKDPKATFIGFKGGDNGANHSHLDLGTFVMESQGQRWAIDLGADTYDLVDYFGKARYTYYRLKTEGHNTILLDGANQAEKAKAPVSLMTLQDRTLAIADLTAAYPGKLRRHQRGVALLADQSVLVQDEIDAAQPVDIQWLMHTLADVRADGNHALLSQKGVYLHLRVLEPSDAVFSVTDANAPAPQNANKGVQKLVIHLPAKAAKARIVVWMVPSTSMTLPINPPIASDLQQR